MKKEAKLGRRCHYSNGNIISEPDMACKYRFPKSLDFLVILAVVSCSFIGLVSANRELDEDNWKQILEGEWMVEFYAPWCPACNALSPAWTELSNQASKKSLSMKAAAVDVTKSPGLSGRFVVTALPTIFHVKDGEFRQYKGPRDVDSMLSFVEMKRWQAIDPVPGWKAPDSLQMTLVAEFFKLSQVLRSVHTVLLEQWGLPPWGSYLIFALATIFIGALLGLILVCIIDLLYPPRRMDKVQVSLSEARGRSKDGIDGGPEEEPAFLQDDIVDEDSEAERNSPPDTEEEGEAELEEDADVETEEPPKPAGSGEPPSPKGGVRKRKPRKD